MLLYKVALYLESVRRILEPRDFNVGVLFIHELRKLKEVLTLEYLGGNP